MPMVVVQKETSTPKRVSRCARSIVHMLRGTDETEQARLISDPAPQNEEEEKKTAAAAAASNLKCGELL